MKAFEIVGFKRPNNNRPAILFGREAAEKEFFDPNYEGEVELYPCVIRDGILRIRKGVTPAYRTGDRLYGNKISKLENLADEFDKVTEVRKFSPYGFMEITYVVEM